MGKRWTEEEKDYVRAQARLRRSAAAIGMDIGRTDQAVWNMASKMGVSIVWKPPASHPWRQPLTKRGAALEAARRREVTP